jgi:hypothetical protein
MTDPLYISEEDPVDFIGTLDTTPALQLLHGTDSLANYDQAAYADHTDLDVSTGIVRARIFDFTVGTTSWTMTVVHNPGTGTVTWSRGTDHAYYDFGPMTAEQNVDVTATSNASPPVTAQRTIKIKFTPTGAQPDRPRRG